jgi:hypothetical protein
MTVVNQRWGDSLIDIPEYLLFLKCIHPPHFPRYYVPRAGLFISRCSCLIPDYIFLIALGAPVIVSSTRTLYFRSTRNQRGNCSPILAIVIRYCILQLAVFIWCPFTHTCVRLVALGMQGIVPSTPTLFCRSTLSQLRNGSPTFALVLLYCIRQLAVFILCPFTHTCVRLSLLGMQGMNRATTHTPTDFVSAEVSNFKF